ncbi:hypothetical protein ANASTE_01608 [Anaerofustis stercorihominis DSM 17244]|uniref:Uncharacterized protein n=1 Tax=Anaerofustis stercorihominis DSM 17244 TaxID=445971 RepID=B1C8J4_9FIRM|nr:hypothetical protein ANASTE_01608 [Anaerofustis stercorihominis DSM 17244]
MINKTLLKKVRSYPSGFFSLYKKGGHFTCKADSAPLVFTLY